MQEKPNSRATCGCMVSYAFNAQLHHARSLRALEGEVGNEEPSYPPFCLPCHLPLLLCLCGRTRKSSHLPPCLHPVLQVASPPACCRRSPRPGDSLCPPSPGAPLDWEFKDREPVLPISSHAPTSNTAWCMVAAQVVCVDSMWS